MNYIRMGLGLAVTETFRRDVRKLLATHNGEPGTMTERVNIERTGLSLTELTVNFKRDFLLDEWIFIVIL